MAQGGMRGLPRDDHQEAFVRLPYCEPSTTLMRRLHPLVVARPFNFQVDWQRNGLICQGTQAGAGVETERQMNNDHATRGTMSIE